MGMRTFLLNIAKSLVIFALAVWLLGEAVLRFPSAFVAIGYPKEWAQVAQRIESAEHGTISDTLYIGDSVGGQIMPFNDSTSLCSNGAVLPIGNYVLVERALSKSPRVRTVIYMSVPQALGNRFERARTCNNFLKPFLQWRYASLFDSSVERKLDAHPTSRLYYLPPLKVLPFDDLDLDDGVHHDRHVLSDISLHWLGKMDSLCRSRGTEFVLLCPPLGASTRSESSDWAALRAQVLTSSAAHLFPRYFSSMNYLPDSLRRDELHWQLDFMTEHRARLLKHMLAAR